jgi:hypothetical protein
LLLKAGKTHNEDAFAIGKLGAASLYLRSIAIPFALETIGDPWNLPGAKFSISSFYYFL